MQPAAFSFLGYTVEQIFLDQSKYHQSEEISVDFSPECHFSKSKAFAKIILVVSIRNKKFEEAFCSISMIGNFQFNEDITKESIPDYFFQNSIAILYPYIRAFISLLSTQSQSQHILLPTFNLSTPNGLDLSRGEDIQLLRGVVNNLKERQIKRTITVAQAIAALNVIFNNQFTWVRADTTGCSNELTNSIPYGNHSISLSLTPQIQICFLNEKDFKDFFRSLTKVHPNQS